MYGQIYFRCPDCGEIITAAEWPEHARADELAAEISAWLQELDAETRRP